MGGMLQDHTPPSATYCFCNESAIGSSDCKDYTLGAVFFVDVWAMKIPPQGCRSSHSRRTIVQLGVRVKGKVKAQVQVTDDDDTVFHVRSTVLTWVSPDVGSQLHGQRVGRI